MANTKKKTSTHKVAKNDAVFDGKGGFMKKGDTLPDDCDFESLKAKGLAE